MAIIAKIGQILNTPIGASSTKAERTYANASNPFSATSFKGNVLTADVFETKAKATSKNKLTYSALVGSINDAFPTFRKGIESVVAFGNRMKEGVSTMCHKINELGNMEVTIDFAGAGRAMRSSWDSMMNKHSVNNLCNRYSEETLGEMLSSELSMNIVG
ncbi:hypothetical protein IJZ97_05455 [bacterium]|nr:hypothetical protein [bacterium]